MVNRVTEGKKKFELTRTLVGAPIEAIKNRDYDLIGPTIAFQFFLPGAIAGDLVGHAYDVLEKIHESISHKVT